MSEYVILVLKGMVSTVIGIRDNWEQSGPALYDTVMYVTCFVKRSLTYKGTVQQQQAIQQASKNIRSTDDSYGMVIIFCYFLIDFI